MSATDSNMKKAMIIHHEKSNNWFVCFNQYSNAFDCIEKAKKVCEKVGVEYEIVGPKELH